MCSEDFPDVSKATRLEATTLVLRLHDDSARYASLISASLLRDDVIGKQIPLHHSIFRFQLFGKHLVLFIVVRLLPSSPASSRFLVGTRFTDVFILPPLSPPLQPNALVPLLPHAFSEGAQLPTLLHLALNPHPLLVRNHLPSPSIILVHSPHGHGKTSAVVSAAHALHITVIRIQPSFLLPHIGTPKALSEALNTYLSAAKASAPTLLVIDDAQFIFPPDDSRRACVFPPFIDAVRNTVQPVSLVIIVSPHTSAVHPTILSSVDLVFSLRLNCTGPFATDVASVHSSLPVHVLQSRLSRQPPHFSIAHVVQWARSQSQPLCPIQTPSAQSNPTEGQYSQLNRSCDLGSELLEKWHSLSKKLPALENALLALRRALLFPVLKKEAFVRLHIQPVRALLLYGAPGTGKTAVVRAAAAAAGYSIVPVDAAMVAHGEVGAAEQRLIQIYNRAKLQRPAVIFLDEVDALFGTSRPQTGENVASLHSLRLVGTLTRCLDAQHEGLVTVAATNRPWVVSRALLRPGRFEYCVRVPLPDSEERARIANVFADEIQLPSPERHCLVTLAKSPHAAGLSGADIAGACRRAVMSALSHSNTVNSQHLRDAFHSTTASVSVTDAHMIDTWCSGSS